MSKIIFLNGCGSSGKSSIAKSIQHLSPEPWLHFGIDTLIDMMPSQYIAFGNKAKEGYFTFEKANNNRGEVVKIATTPLGRRVFSLMPKLASMIAGSGNLIIDEVLTRNEELLLYTQELEGHKVFLVGVLCDLVTMQEREFLRGDRVQGLSNEQFDKVHAELHKYDITVDTTRHSPFECARKILDYIAQY